MNNDVIKSNEDLVVGKINHDPEGKMIYDPMVAKLTVWYGLVGAVIFGVFAYLIASGAMPIRDFGQLSTSGNGVATFVGAVIGIAIGGLTGSLIGLTHIVKQNRKRENITKKK